MCGEFFQVLFFYMLKHMRLHYVPVLVVRVAARIRSEGVVPEA